MIRIFISYAHADEALRQELDKHLMSLKHQGLIEVWHDRRIAVGEEWANAIDANLRSADVILLLVSSDFIASRYCYEVELQEALRRHAAGKAVVIPVILRPCDWNDLPFGKLQAATRDGRPITKFPTWDEGFLEVVRAIKAAAKKIQGPAGSPASLATMVTGQPQGNPPTYAPARPMARSSNLHVKKSFTDHDRDAFRIGAFEYIAAFFENSMSELQKRNPHLKTQFRRRDVNSFEATVYENGKQATRCGIWLGSGRFAGDIAYSHSGLGNGNSYNGSLSIADDGQLLGLKALGMVFHGGTSEHELLTLDGAAEYFWSIFIQPLQDY